MSGYNMNTFYTSNYYVAEEMEEGVLIEAIVEEVGPKDFDEQGEIVSKAVVRFDTGKAAVLNQTRLRAMIAGFGPHSENWIGRKIIISKGMTHYSGRPVPCVVLEPIVRPRHEGGGGQSAQVEGPPKSGPADATTAVPAAPADEPRRPRGKMTVIGGSRRKTGGSALDDLAARRPDLRPKLDDDIPW